MERRDYRTLRELLGLNLGKGYFSLDRFKRACDVDTDASKSRRYAGGGYVSYGGSYRFWRYGVSAARAPIDYLEGDAVVLCVRDLGASWRQCIVRFRVDNTAFQKSAVKGWSRAERLATLVRELFVLALQFECVYEFDWVASAENVFADALSRENGECLFLSHAREDPRLSSVTLRRDPRCGEVRQLGSGYSSNSLRDGPGQRGVDSALTVTYPRASIFVGLPTSELEHDVDVLMDGRLEASSWRSIRAALGH